jgi:hypothetical protein
MPGSIDVTHSTFIIELAPGGLARGAKPRIANRQIRTIL